MSNASTDSGIGEVIRQVRADIREIRRDQKEMQREAVGSHRLLDNRIDRVTRELDGHRAAGSDNKRHILGMPLRDLILYGVLTEVAGVNLAQLIGWL